MRFIKLLAFCTLICIYIPETLAQYDGARSRLDQVFESNDLIGCSVIGICNNEIEFEYYNGFSDVERGLRIDENTSYRIASISKNISTILLLRLAQEGRIDLDADVNTYLPFEIRNPNFPEEVLTPRMFLSHRSSIIDGSGYGSFLSATYSSDVPPSLAELLDTDGSYYTLDLYLQIPPGTYFSYSNLNYGVVASLVEAVSGQRFDQYAEEILFEPLSLDAGYHPSYLSDINNLAVLYRKSGSQWNPQWDDYRGVAPALPALEGYIPGTNGLFFSPQGGVRMSAKDLASIVKLHLHNGSLEDTELLSPEFQNLMEEPTWNYDGQNGNNYFGLFRSWGLGTHISTINPSADIVFPGKEMKGHPGAAYGLISDMYYDETSGTGVIFITNGSGIGYTTGNTAFYTVEDSIFQIIYEEVIEPCQQSTSVETTDERYLEVFPNPVSDVLHFKGSGLPLETSVQILKVDGKIILEEYITENAVDVSRLVTGVYFLQILNESGVVIAEQKFYKM